MKMDKKISLTNYAPVISTKEQGARLLAEICESNPRENQIIIDFSHIMTMTTFVAKQVFGQLYKDLGKQVFFNNIKFRNTTPGISMILKIGISSFA